MAGKEAIINRILSDARAGEKARLDEAQEKVDEIMLSAKNAVDEVNAQFEGEKKTLKSEILNRAEIVASLDGKKFVLDAKNSLVSKTFEAVLEKLKNLPDKTYEKLIFSMLENATDGDTLTISEREKKFVTEEKVKDFASKKKIKLSLNKKMGDFDGGIILSGSGVDKNITFETEVSLLKEELEESVSKMLFAEDK